MTQVNTVTVDNTVTDTNVVALEVADKYNANTVRQFVDATKAVKGNFQTFITEAIEADKVSCILDYVMELYAEHGKGKDMNSALSCIRPPLARACEKLDLPKMTIKWDKNTERYVFSESKAQAKKDEDESGGESEGTNDEPVADSIHSEAAKLMAEFLANRTVDNAAKVTEFVMSLVN